MAVNNFFFDDFLILYGRKISFEKLKRISFEYGMEIEGELEDGEFSVEITPERPDMYSIEGYARALRGFTGLEKGLRKYDYDISDVDLLVEKETSDIRPFIGAAIIKDVEVDDAFLRSIIRFQEKIHFTLGRKRKKIAIGIYDFDKIVPPVHYRAVDPKSIKFIPLEFDEELTLEEILKKHPTGKEYKHLLEDFEKYPLLIDSIGNVLSFPPIINSNYSGKVTEKTKNLFIEVTGTHEPTLFKTVNMLTTSISDRGGIIEKVKVKYSDREIISPTLENENLSIDLDFINGYLGLNLTARDVKENLQRMLYDVEIKEIGKKEAILRTRNKSFRLPINFVDKIVLEVTSPSYRVDVLSECDVVEDVAIAYGYGNFEIVEPDIYTIGKGSAREEFSMHIREICAGIGLTEVMTLILTNSEDQYSRMNLPIDIDYVSVFDSKSNEHNIARVRVFPELLKFLRNNKNKESPISIFEVEDSIKIDKEEFTGSKDIRKLAIAEMGSSSEYSRIRSLVDGVFDNLGVEYRIEKSELPYYLKGRQGDIYVENEKVGELGETHPNVLNNFMLDLPVISAEIDLDMVYRNVKRRL